MLLEAKASLKGARYAAEVTRELLLTRPDLVGLYVAGGGVSGVIAALREEGAQSRIVTVGHDLTPNSATD
jgi:LacI family transcriptional regulator